MTYLITFACYGCHVHILVEAEVRPERIMNDLKEYASRCLNRLGLDEPVRKAVGAARKYAVVVGGDSVCRGEVRR